jgi:hypothetical protein
MDLKSKTVKELRTMLKEIKSASMGVRDIILTHAIEDEIANRK